MTGQKTMKKDLQDHSLYSVSEFLNMYFIRIELKIIYAVNIQFIFPKFQ